MMYASVVSCWNEWKPVVGVKSRLHSLTPLPGRREHIAGHPKSADIFGEKFGINHAVFSHKVLNNVHVMQVAPVVAKQRGLFFLGALPCRSGAFRSQL